MTPAKEKAIELVRQFYSIGANECKQCALIAVDEMINTLNGLEDSVWYFNMNSFLQEVKQEIEKR